MKKTALITLLTALATWAANAQTAYDAWLFSENNYEGTARSVAMGNAFTALGGDLGAVTINPASSAVAGYSQMTITPSLTFSSNTAYGITYDGNPSTTYFQNKMNSRMTRAGLPNAGFTINFNTGRNSGLKSVTAGFVVNKSNSWSEDVFAEGTNSQTSFLAAMAYDATLEIAALNKANPSADPEYSKLDYLAEDAFDYMNWKNTVGYRSGMFSAFDKDGKLFAGATETVTESNGETNLMQDGAVSQSYGRSISGDKYEYLLNVGMNISDFVYIGFNLGINSLTYDKTFYFREGAIDRFENIFYDKDNVEHVTYFKSSTYKHSYSADGTGVYGKLGIIVTPGGGLRFGAAIQTPTTTTIKEQWQISGQTRFEDSSFNGDAESDMGYYEYCFNSPWRASFGAAYTLGKFAAFSVDYELAGFGSMRYEIDRNSMNEDDIEHFEIVNDDISKAYGTAHYLRLGAEIKPLSSLAVRAGYNLGTDAQKKYYDMNEDRYFDLDPLYSHNVSFGVGYNSKKSFFADIACRYTLPTEEIIDDLYSDYLEEIEGPLPPMILNRHSNWKVLLTLGWRF